MTKILTELHKQHIRASCVGINKGIKRSDEYKRKMSLIKTGQPSPNKGKKLSRGWCEALSNAHKGQIPWNKRDFSPKFIKQRIRRKWETKREMIKFHHRLRRNLEFGAVGSHTDSEWEIIKKFYNYMCLCCKQSEPDIILTRDHIIPLSKGGTDFVDNIQPLCMSCNSRKHTKSISYLPIGSNSSIFALPN